jgi:hypothetical protein
MYTLEATDSFRIPTPDTYIYDIISIAAGVAVISSDDSLRLLDPLALNGAPINSVRMINESVTCLKAFSPNADGGAEIVCTAGRDGRAVLLDPRSGSRVDEVRSGECRR